MVLLQNTLYIILFGVILYKTSKVYNISVKDSGRGIPKDKILKEEMSTSTYTNLINSKKILDCYFDSYYNVVIVTSNYHIYRTQNIANDIGLSSTHIHANIKWYEYPIRCFRENVAIIKYWLDNCFQ